MFYVVLFDLFGFELGVGFMGLVLVFVWVCVWRFLCVCRVGFELSVFLMGFVFLLYVCSGCVV